MSGIITSLSFCKWVIIMNSIYTEQVFNDRSANGSYQTIDDACEGMNRFCELFKYVSDAGMGIFYIPWSFRELKLCNSFYIKTWLFSKNSKINQNLRSFFLTKATKNPQYFEEELKKYNSDCHLIKDYLYKGESCFGLKLAFFKNTNVLSLDGDEQFLSNTIMIDEIEYSDTLEPSNIIAVLSLSNTEQASKRLYDSIRNGNELIHYQPVLFSFLSIADKARKQLSELHGNERYFRSILEHFSILNTSMFDYQKNGEFKPVGIEWTDESDSVQNNKSFLNMRKFICNDGIERFFTKHSKIRSNNIRIHFYPDLEKRIVHIGYVGEHLPTTQFPH